MTRRFAAPFELAAPSRVTLPRATLPARRPIKERLVRLNSVGSQFAPVNSHSLRAEEGAALGAFSTLNSYQLYDFNNNKARKEGPARCEAAKGTRAAFHSSKDAKDERKDIRRSYRRVASRRVGKYANEANAPVSGRLFHPLALLHSRSDASKC